MTRTEIIRQQVAAYPELSPGDLAAYLNTEKTNQFKRVSISELHEWANIHRIARRFYDQEGNPVHPLLKLELEQLIHGKQESVNVNSSTAGVSGLISDLVAAGIFTMAEVAELQSLGTEEVTLAQSIGIGGVTYQEVVDAIGPKSESEPEVGE